MRVRAAARRPDSRLPAHSWQGEGKPKEAVEQHEWGVNGNVTKRYV